MYTLRITLPAGSIWQRNRPSVLHRGRKSCLKVRGQQGTATQHGVCLPSEHGAYMGQPTLKVEVKENVLRRLEAQAEHSWPGQGVIGRDRLVRDALRRHVRYSDGKAGTRGKR